MAAAHEGGGAECKQADKGQWHRPRLARAQLRAKAISSSFRSEQGSCCCTAPSPAWETSSFHGGDECGVDGELGAPPQRDASGTPLGMTSMRWSFCRTRSTLKSRTSTLRATAAPVPPNTRAAARLIGPPLARKTPERRQAARRSSLCVQLHRRRSSSSTQQCEKDGLQPSAGVATPHERLRAQAGCRAGREFSL